MVNELIVGQLYSNEEIITSLNVGNAGGIRLSAPARGVVRAAIMTAREGLHGAGENPYNDRLEGGTLTYTAAGKIGEQTLSGPNRRLIEQRAQNFPLHGFALTASRRDKAVGARRWKYLGLLEYLRHYPDTQLDVDGKARKVWIFELRVHDEPKVVPIANDAVISNEVLTASRSRRADDPDDDEIAQETAQQAGEFERLENVRGKLLSLDPREFELFIKGLLQHCGFADVHATKFSADGGVDVNAKAGPAMWAIANTVVQVQAKRWLHSVGRKEVAELRGSLQPFARGAVVTTSHFSKAAINEAREEEKNPIVLVDGLKLSQVVLSERFPL